MNRTPRSYYILYTYSFKYLKFINIIPAVYIGCILNVSNKKVYYFITLQLQQMSRIGLDSLITVSLSSLFNNSVFFVLFLSCPFELIQNTSLYLLSCLLRRNIPLQNGTHELL